MLCTTVWAMKASRGTPGTVPALEADVSSQAITGPYRRLHPEDNNERQALHEHVSVPLPVTASAPRSRTAAHRETRRCHPSEAPDRCSIRTIDHLREKRPSRNVLRSFSSLSPRLCVSVVRAFADERFSLAENVHFSDITAQAGIHFTHNNGAFGKNWLPETMGPGCAFIDYDNDGYPTLCWSMAVTGTSASGKPNVEAISQ